ncbi:organic cation transporter protein isoform X2 [Exaiptasia diaphana]|nr:organic cation transporter protein isoform X2 [Exaiptasia diaphana]XP_020914742.1 organic cation transporter protein isoform X2 [Exaiptasia diaphana]
MVDNRRTENSGREYDDVFDHVKSFGRYQVILYVLVSLYIFPITSQFAMLIFATGTPGFHCVTSNVTCPKKQCCDGCTSYVFDGPFDSVVSEWKLICDRAYLGATIQACFFGGMCVGSFLTGMLSDAWGRKNCIFFCNAILLLSGVGSALVDCISFFAFLRFLVGFGTAGTMLTLYVYGMELVGPKFRTAVGNAVYIYFNVLAMITALISYLIPSWRILIIVTTSPAVLLFVFWKCIPESPRWLVAHGQLEQGANEIRKYGAKDGGPVDDTILRSLLEEVRSEQIKANEENKKYTSIDLLRTPKIRKWSVIVCYEWFAVSLVSFGILLFMTQLSGDIYLNYIVTRIAATIRVPFTYIIYLKFGRRVPNGVIMIVIGVSLLLVLPVYKDVPTATTALTLIGIILCDFSWTGIYLITAELFPTILRNTAQGTGSTAARIGGIIAPYIAMMGQLPGLSIAFPTTILGCVAILGGILMYWIPETLFSPMHQTVQQTEDAKEDFDIPCCGRKLPLDHNDNTEYRIVTRM